MEAAPAPGAAEVIPLRPTAIPRPYIHPRLAASNGHPGHDPDDPAVHRDGEAILVPTRVPVLDDGQQRRLHPTLRAEYRRRLAQ